MYFVSVYILVNSVARAMTSCLHNLCLLVWPTLVFPIILIVCLVYLPSCPPFVPFQISFLGFLFLLDGLIWFLFGLFLISDIYSVTIDVVCFLSHIRNKFPSRFSATVVSIRAGIQLHSFPTQQSLRLQGVSSAN